jgi:hypothetical protein
VLVTNNAEAILVADAATALDIGGPRLILDGLNQSILPISIIDAPTSMQFGPSVARVLTRERADELYGEDFDIEAAPAIPALPGATSVVVRQPQ